MTVLLRRSTFVDLGIDLYMSQISGLLANFAVMVYIAVAIL